MFLKKKRCCCGLFALDTAFTFITKLIVLSDFMIILFILYMALLLMLGSLNALPSDWYVDYVRSSAVSEQMFLEIFAAIMFVLIPLDAMLIYKSMKGEIWRRSQKRTAFHNYYFASMVFYIAFVI